MTISYPRMFKNIDRNKLQWPTSVVSYFSSYLNRNIKILKSIKFPQKNGYYSSVIVINYFKWLQLDSNPQPLSS